MLAAFERSYLFLKPKSSSLLLNRMCWNCLYHVFLHRKGLLAGAQHRRSVIRSQHYRDIDSFSSVLVGVPWTWRHFLILDSTLGNCKSMVTQASSSEDEQTDELLNQIHSKIERSPNLASDISSSQIEKLCCGNNISAALELFESIRDREIFLEAKAYNLLLLAAGKASNVKLVSQIFKDFLSSNKPMSATCFLNLAKAFEDTNDENTLLSFITSVSDLAFPRSTTVINRIIYAFDVCGQMEKALLIYNHMKSLDCKPDLITYNTVLGILGRAGRADEMLHEFSLMKEAEIIPDIVSYNTLINSFRKLGRLDTCCVFLEEVKERGLQLDLRTYTALIDCFGHSGNMDESLRLLNEMKMKHVKPSIYIYRSLINNAKKLGRTELALRFLEEMNGSKYNLVGPKDFKKKKR